MAGKHKNRVMKTGKKYTEWLSDQSDRFNNDNPIDALDGEGFGDGQTPWARPAISDVEYDQIDELYDLYDRLKGRRKAVLKLLLQGETNHEMIAKALNMSRPNVTICIQEIRKEALKNHTK